MRCSEEKPQERETSILADQYLSIFDFVSILFWLGISLLAINFHYSQNSHKTIYKYYWRNILAKLLFSFAYSIFYVFIIQGGDTVAYFDGAKALNNLCIESPSAYFTEMWNPSDMVRYWNTFSPDTGFPPGWIYKEQEGFFVSKVVSVISFFTFKSYFATNLILSLITAHASWKLFKLVAQMNVAKLNYVAIAILFIPSVNFWCSGISKDSFVYIGLCYLVYCSFNYFINGKFKLRHLLGMLLGAWLIYNTRSVVLVLFLIPFSLVFFTRLLKRMGAKSYVAVGLRALFLAGSFGLMIYSQASKSEAELLQSNSVLQEAQITQNDFVENKTYGENKYDLGEIEFSLTGLIRVAPIATFTGIFRPFLWEALDPSLILNGLESVLLLYGLMRFVIRQPFRKYRYIRNNEFLYFALIFIFLLGFTIGLTAGLYGVLVRLRAPLLPFLFLILNIDYNLQKREKEAALE